MATLSQNRHAEKSRLGHAIRVSAELYASIIEERARLFRDEDRTHSTAVILDRAWGAYKRERDAKKKAQP